MLGDALEVPTSPVQEQRMVIADEKLRKPKTDMKLDPALPRPQLQMTTANNKQLQAAATTCTILGTYCRDSFGCSIHHGEPLSVHGHQSPCLRLSLHIHLPIKSDSANIGG